MHYRSISRDVTAAILVYQNNETAAMLVYQASLVSVEKKQKRFFGVP